MGLHVKALSNSKIYLAGNVVIFGNTVVQLSNITRCWTGYIPKEPLNLQALLVCAVAGLVLTLIGLSYPLLLIPGLLLLGLAAYMYHSHSKKESLYSMHMELTSQSIYSFTSNDQTFLRNAFFEFSAALAKPQQGNIIQMIDFSKNSHNTVTSGISNIGDGSTLKNIVQSPQ